MSNEVKMRKIVTTYADGVFGWRDALDFDEVTVEVAETTIVMWEAVLAADRVMQKQLQELDNQFEEAWEAKNKEKEQT